MPAMASGILIVITDQGEAELAVSDQGLIIGAMIRGKGDQGLFALKKILDWKIGEYAFFEGNEYPNEHIKKTLRMDMLSIVRGMEAGGAPQPPRVDSASVQNMAPGQSQPQGNPAAYNQAPAQQMSNQSGQYQPGGSETAGPVGLPLSAPPMPPAPGYQPQAYAAQGQGYAQAPQYGGGQGQETQGYGGAPVQAQPQAYGQQQGYSQPSNAQPAPQSQHAPSNVVPAEAARPEKKKPRKFASTNFAMDVFADQEAPKIKADEKVDDLMHNLTNLNRLGPSATAQAARPTQSSMSTSQVMKTSQSPPPSGIMPPAGSMPQPGMVNQGMVNPGMVNPGMVNPGMIQPAAGAAPASQPISNLQRQAAQEVQQNAYLAEQQLLQSISSPAPGSSPASALQNLMAQSTSGGYPDPAYQQQQQPANAAVAPSYAVPQAPPQQAQPAPQPPPVPPAPPAPPPQPPQPAPPTPPAPKKVRAEVTATLIEAPVFIDDNLFDDPSQQSSLLSAPEPPSYGTQSGTDYNAVNQGTQSGTDYNAINQGTQSGTDYNAINQGTQSGTNYDAVSSDAYGNAAPSSMSSRNAAGGASGLNPALPEARTQSNQDFSQAPSFGPGAAATSGATPKSPGSAILEAMKRRQLGIPEDQPLPSSSESLPPVKPEPQQPLQPALPPVAQGVPPFLQGRPESVPSVLSRPEAVPPALGRPAPAPLSPSLSAADQSDDPFSLDKVGTPRDMSASATYGARQRESLPEDSGYAEANDYAEQESRSGGTGRSRMSKPGLSSRGMKQEASFFEKNRMLVIIGFVLFIFVLVAAIIGALFFFHIISLNPAH